MRDCVTGIQAEIVDLSAYRARRAREVSRREMPAVPMLEGFVCFATFIMPMAVVVFWSPWFIARPPAAVDGDGD
jgi:hypothetical protein